MLSSFLIAVLALPMVLGCTPTLNTTSGLLQGSEDQGVISFKGIPFAEAPVGDLRWQPPKPFTSTDTRNASAFSPSCIQQFPIQVQALFIKLFNTPPVPESEDCLFLNVWTPSLSGPKKPVIFWIHGGGFALGTASTPEYDGTSFAQNQDLVVVTVNYRTNAFGFPAAEELFPSSENLGLMDQDVALSWVQQNIAAFGGDPHKVTIMGQSAGAISVAHAIQRHAVNPPFRAAIMQSGSAASMRTTPRFTSFDALAKAVNCTQQPGAERIACMKAVPADTIRSWENGPQGLNFASVIVDNATAFPDPIQRIQQNKTARVPILLGGMEDDGSLFTVGQTSLPNFLNATLGPLVTADQVRNVYPALNDTQIIPTVFRDLTFLCTTAATADAFVQSGMKDVFRYKYGAVFKDLQLFPNAGAWHTSEIGEIFGTFNSSTASASEVTLSRTMQTIWATFAKDLTAPSVTNWPRYVPGNDTKTLAKLAFVGNVKQGNVVQQSSSGLDDGPCEMLWNKFVAF